MSEAKHTPGPWSADGAYVLRPDGGCIKLESGWQDGVMKDDPEAHANARRIFACVNACEGVPTAALEADVVKELLAACEKMYEVYAQEHLLRSEVGLGDEEIELGKARAECLASAAIAKAKGERDE